MKRPCARWHLLIFSFMLAHYACCSNSMISYIFVEGCTLVVFRCTLKVLPREHL
jgi:hypothetical protein